MFLRKNMGLYSLYNFIRDLFVADFNIVSDTFYGKEMLHRNDRKLK